MRIRNRRHLALLALGVLFAGRVVAQLVQWFADVRFLPDFDSWQSGAVPYGGLVAAQIVILAVIAAVIARVSRQVFEPSDRSRAVLGVLGVVYFGFMLFRGAAGLTFGSGHDWWDAPLPTIFHLVLAGFVLTVAVRPWGIA